MPIGAGNVALIDPEACIGGTGEVDGDGPGRKDAPVTTAIAAGVRMGPGPAGDMDPGGASEGDDRGAGGASEGDDRGTGGASEGDDRGTGGGTDGDERLAGATLAGSGGGTDGDERGATGGGGAEGARGAMGAWAARGTTDPDRGNDETGRGGPWFLCFRSSDATAAPM